MEVLMILKKIFIIFIIDYFYFLFFQHEEAGTADKQVER